MDAYAEAFLGKDAPEPPDAMTVSPYLGYGSFRPAIDLAHATGRGIFVLALTSNPEGPAAVQHARARRCRASPGTSSSGATARQRRTLAAATSSGRSASWWGRRSAMRSNGVGAGPATGMGGPFLAPGVGAQGRHSPRACAEVFGAALPDVLAAIKPGGPRCWSHGLPRSQDASRRDRRRRWLRRSGCDRTRRYTHGASERRALDCVASQG
jgi:orotidine-5'-phosphate decarboxylase